MLRTLLFSFLVLLLSCAGLRAQGWEKTFGGNKVDIGYSVKTTTDGGLIACGVTTSNNDYDDILIIRLDIDGDVVWSKTYGAADIREYGLSIIETSDGGFAVSGYSKETISEANEDVFLLKIDAWGNELWSETYGGEEADFGFFRDRNQ